MSTNLSKLQPLHFLHIELSTSAWIIVCGFVVLPTVLVQNFNLLS